MTTDEDRRSIALIAADLLGKNPALSPEDATSKAWDIWIAVDRRAVAADYAEYRSSMGLPCLKEGES